MQQQFRSPFLRAAGLLLAVTSFALADDWPQWRGPSRDAVWSEKDPSLSDARQVIWTIESGGGYASPIVSGRRVYIFDSDLQKPNARERLRCLDLESGHLIWAQSYPVNYPEWAFDPNNKAGPNSTPILKEGRIYSIGSNGDLFCRDALLGSLIWSTNLTTSFGLRDYAAVTPSPLIEENLLITVPGGENATVVAFNKFTGKEEWRALKDSWTYSSPIVISVAGKRQLVVWTPKAVTSLDALTGTIIWREIISSPGDMTVSSPVFCQDHLLAGGLMFQLGPAALDHKLLWGKSIPATKRIFSNTSTPVITSNLVFTGTTEGKLLCLDRESRKILWETNSVTLPGNGSSLHLTPLRESYLIFTDQGDLIHARLHSAGYHEFKRLKAIEPLYAFAGKKVTWTPPTFASQSAILRNGLETIRIALTAKP